MHNMFWWGKNHSFQWYEQVVDSLGVLLDNNAEYEVVDQREIVRHLIAFEVKAMILQEFALGSPAFDVTFDQWWINFNSVYKKDDFKINARYTFRDMAEYSFEYVEWLIVEVKEDFDMQVKVEEEMELPDTVNSA